MFCGGPGVLSLPFKSSPGSESSSHVPFPPNHPICKGRTAGIIKQQSFNLVAYLATISTSTDHHQLRSITHSLKVLHFHYAVQGNLIFGNKVPCRIICHCTTFYMPTCKDSLTSDFMQSTHILCYFIKLCLQQKLLAF